MIVDTEKVSREADGPEGNTSASCLVSPSGGKVIAPGCASKSGRESRVEPEEHKRKEVELVDSVGELRSSSSTHGISMPNFEVLDARIASALNKIIHNSHFKRRIILEEQKAQKNKENLFSNRRWTNQNPWKRSGTENIHLDTAATNSRRGSH